jgi:hypothetical protein
LILGYSTKISIASIRDDYFQFSSVFIKKNNQTNFFLKKNWKQTETGFGSVRFFRTKTDSNRFGSGFWFGSVFSVWLGFFRFGFGSVRFFGFKLIKPKPNRISRFIQNFNRFFLQFSFFSYFFLDFFSFLVFFSP